MKVAWLLGLLIGTVASAQTIPDRKPVYIWGQRDLPEKAFIQNLGRKATVTASTLSEGYVLLADSARAMNCNGVVNIRVLRNEQGLKILADMVTFRDPAKLDLRHVWVVK